MATLASRVERWAHSADARLAAWSPAPRVDVVGRVERVADGIAMVSGLPQAASRELLAFSGGIMGFAHTLDENLIGCVLLDPIGHLAAGDIVRSTGQVAGVPVGEQLLGRIVDPLGRPLDDGPVLKGERFDPVERAAPEIIARDLVKVPMETGLTVIDAMFALGRGQRELIIGDRATGKTALAVDAIINQRHGNVVSIYIAIGQKTSTVKSVVEAVRAHGSPERTIFVVAEANGPAGLQWLAPYAGMTMAEFFRDRGDDVLVVIDDLTKHANVHRQISLLLRQPPGREAFPGDIFYTHSRLLERAAHLSKDLGGGSITALPIAETAAGNLSAYIPTNLISITDGQIVLDTQLFADGRRPAVDVGRSVSRVGGKTQRPAMRAAAGGLRLDYVQFMEMESFSRFGGLVDERTRAVLDHGSAIRGVLVQGQHQPLRETEQVALLVAVGEGLLDGLAQDVIAAFRAELPAVLARDAGDVAGRIESSGELSDEDRAMLVPVLRSLAEAHRPPKAAP